MRDAPWSIVFTQDGGEELRTEALGFLDATGTRRDGPLGVSVTPAGEGAIAVELTAPGGREVHLGAVRLAAGRALLRLRRALRRRRARAGCETENYVADGPVRPEDRQYVKASVPPWADRERDDATYYPVPWLLSSRGYGVLIDEDATSRFRTALGGAPRGRPRSTAPRLRLRVFAGPTPAGALRRFTAAVGRQPPPQAPWTFGPWFQTGQPNVVPVEEERAITKAQRDAGAPVSVAETQMHYLPCGAHKGREAAERERTDSFHRDGLARLVYFNPLALRLLLGRLRRARRPRACSSARRAAPPFSYPAFVGGSGPLGFTQEPLAQFDFTHPATEDFYAGLVRGGGRPAAPTAGWRTSASRRRRRSSSTTAPPATPPTTATRPTTTARSSGSPRASTGRSCASSARAGPARARCAEVVWGGDPTHASGASTASARRSRRCSRSA